MQEFTELEIRERIIDMADYYSFILWKLLKKNRKALKNDKPEEHKNWKHFAEIERICRENDWDYRLYVEFAFEEVVLKWNIPSLEYPQPYTLKNKTLQKNFPRWLEKENNKHAYNTGRRERVAQEILTPDESIIKQIERSCKTLKMYMQSQKPTPEIRKAQEILYDIDCRLGYYSVYYLYTIPVAREFVDMLEDGVLPFIDNLKYEFYRIDKNPKRKKLIKTTVKMMEEYYKIPGNIEFEKFLEYVKKEGG